jgi:uncharacterized damage-inducible protein DinB
MNTIFGLTIIIGGYMKFSKMIIFCSIIPLISAGIFPADKFLSTDKGIRAEIVQELIDTEEKVSSLAKDIPQSKFTWRPEEGVRSISEVILHVAAANYFLLSFAGIKPPEDMKMDSDFDKKTTNKEEILDFVKTAYAFTRNKIMAMNDKDLEKMVDFFGTKLTTRHLLVKLAGHNHEHLGQLIAYSRMNGVVPSWSKKQN